MIEFAIHFKNGSFGNTAVAKHNCPSFYLRFSKNGANVMQMQNRREKTMDSLILKAAKNVLSFQEYIPLKTLEIATD